MEQTYYSKNKEAALKRYYDNRDKIVEQMRQKRADKAIAEGRTPGKRGQPIKLTEEQRANFREYHREYCRIKNKERREKLNKKKLNK